MGWQPEDSNSSSKKPPLHLRRDRQMPTKMFHAFSKPRKPGFFVEEGGRGDWLRMDSFLFSDYFWIGTFVCVPQAHLSSTTEPTLTPSRG